MVRVAGPSPSPSRLLGCRLRCPQSGTRPGRPSTHPTPHLPRRRYVGRPAGEAEFAVALWWRASAAQALSAYALGVIAKGLAPDPQQQVGRRKRAGQRLARCARLGALMVRDVC